MAQQDIRVAMVEDNDKLLRSLRTIVDQAEGLEVAGTYLNGEDFLAAIPKLEVDVVVMDINLPGKNGIDCIREAKVMKPSVQFMVLTVFESPAYVFQALCAGATGYLVKGRASEELIDSIRDLHEGGSPMSSAIARLVVGSFQRETQQRINDEKLTDREKEVLDQLANGLQYKEIAAKAGISVETVRRHVHSIYAKLQVSSRHEAVRKAYPGN